MKEDLEVPEPAVGVRRVWKAKRRALPWWPVMWQTENQSMDMDVCRCSARVRCVTGHASSVTTASQTSGNKSQQCQTHETGNVKDSDLQLRHSPLCLEKKLPQLWTSQSGSALKLKRTKPFMLWLFFYGLSTHPPTQFKVDVSKLSNLAHYLAHETVKRQSQTYNSNISEQISMRLLI